MSEGQRWTPGAAAPTGPEAPSTGQGWNAPAPAPAYLGDPRWGIRADLPSTAPAAAPPSAAYGAAPAGGPSYAPPTPPAPSPGPAYGAPSATPAYAPPTATPTYAPPTVGGPPFGTPSFGMPTTPAGPGRTGFAPVTFAPPMAQFAPVRAKNPGWVVALAVLGIGTFVVAIGAAVAIPVFLNSRSKVVTTQLRADLMSVASAEEAVRSQTGSYSADPDAVTAQLGSGLSSRVSIMWADANGWCGQAVPVGKTTPQLYFSTQSGISEQSCG